MRYEEWGVRSEGPGARYQEPGSAAQAIVLVLLLVLVLDRLGNEVGKR